MILSDLELYAVLAGLAAIFGAYWWAVTAAMRREMRELEAEIERNLWPATDHFASKGTNCERDDR